MSDEKKRQDLRLRTKQFALRFIKPERCSPTLIQRRPDPRRPAIRHGLATRCRRTGSWLRGSTDVHPHPSPLPEGEGIRSQSQTVRSLRLSSTKQALPFCSQRREPCPLSPRERDGVRVGSRNNHPVSIRPHGSGQDVPHSPEQPCGKNHRTRFPVGAFFLGKLSRSMAIVITIIKKSKD